ncbi:septum formation family protein [Demequina oxidasica]|uniref:septum formation family protein n=1 Tax=Demequina oxidasica TaxID=676199 RepID=UPI000B12394B|nr:septum formation family protein [Demequina oxidasica]
MVQDDESREPVVFEPQELPPELAGEYRSLESAESVPNPDSTPAYAPQMGAPISQQPSYGGDPRFGGPSVGNGISTAYGSGAGIGVGLGAAGAQEFDWSSAQGGSWGVRTNSSKNWQGIASLVTSLLGLSLLGVLFGWAGLRSAKAGDATNRGLSMAGIAIGGVSMALGLILGAAFLLPALSLLKGPNVVDSVAVGECFNESDSSGLDEATVYGFAIVDCTEPHIAQAFHVGLLTDEPYPGEQALWEVTDTLCHADSLVAAIDSESGLELTTIRYVPSAEVWAEGVRQYQCAVGPVQGQVSESLVLRY